jgi:hypothetical protein
MKLIFINVLGIRSPVLNCVDFVVAESLSEVVIVVLGHYQVSPAVEVAPVSADLKAVVDVGDGAILSQGHQLGSTNDVVQLHEHVDVAVVVVRAGVAVETDQISPVFTGVPVWFRSAPHPDQVVKLVVVVEPFEHDVEQLLACP